MKANNFFGSKLCVIMKFAFKAALCAVTICFAVSMTEFDAQSQAIASEVVRLHILANSDSFEDQSLKIKVRDAVQQSCEELYPEGCGKEQAETLIEKKLPEIIRAAQSVVESNGYDYRVTGRIVNMYFTARQYDNFTLPAGYYDAVRIEIGSGSGHNWWCVMFPPVCISAAEGDISDVLTDEQTKIVREGETEYRFKIYDMIKDLISVEC